jgi:large conductance mechanosensitive channel
MIKGYRDFILRGNVVELAVAVVMGAAFGGVVKALSDDFIGGFIGIIGKQDDFSKAHFTIHGSQIVYGSTLTALINFLIVGAVVYFVIVTPFKRLGELLAMEAKLAPDIELLTEIRDELRAQRGEAT